MSSKTPSPSEKHLFLIATTTQEKVERYQAAADEMGLPLIFVNLKELALFHSNPDRALFHSAKEDKHTMEGNAEQKLGETERIFQECTTPGSETHRALAALARHYGVDLDPAHMERIHIGTDDATFMVPEKVWQEDGKQRLHERLAHAVDNDLLDSSKSGGEESGPGAESGPIIAAAGTRNTYNYIRESAIDAKYGEHEPIPIENYTVLALRTLSKPHAEPEIFRGETHLILHTPSGGHIVPFTTKDIDLTDPKSLFVTSSHFLANPDTPGVIVNGSSLENSSEGRYDIVRQLAEKFLGTDTSKLTALPPHLREPSRLLIPPPEPNTALWKPGESLPEGLLKEMGVAVFDFGTKEAPRKGKDPQVAYELLRPMEETIAPAHALLFTPISPNADHTKAYLQLHSAMVAKQVVPRDMKKPIIIMDLLDRHGKGQWDKAVTGMLDQTRKGMAKDYDRALYAAPQAQTEGVTHIATGLFHYIASKEGAKLNEAAMQILEKEQQNFIKNASVFVPSRREALEVKGDAPHPLYTIAVWTSATSDNKRLLDDLHHLGTELAQKAFGLVWGAGDRHGMGAIYKGYLQGREDKIPGKTWIGGFSTLPLLVTETEHGKMPEKLDYSEVNSDIYQRMANMVHHSDAFVVAPGGIGTSQELLTVLHLQKEMPGIMEGKPIVLFSPDLLQNGKPEGKSKLFWEQPAAAILGKEDWKRLKHDRALAEKNIYLATDKKELEDLLVKLRQKALREPKPYTLALPQNFADRTSPPPYAGLS